MLVINYFVVEKQVLIVGFQHQESFLHIVKIATLEIIDWLLLGAKSWEADMFHVH